MTAATSVLIPSPTTSGKGRNGTNVSAPHFQVRIVLTLSLRQMAVLPPRPHPGAVLGAHVARQLLCQLAGAGRREATGAPGEQAEKVVAAGRVRPAQHLGLVLRLPLQG